MAAVIGGHFFCLPIADGECRGGAAPMHGFAFFVFRSKSMCVFFSVQENRPAYPTAKIFILYMAKERKSFISLYNNQQTNRKMTLH